MMFFNQKIKKFEKFIKKRYLPQKKAKNMYKSFSDGKNMISLQEILCKKRERFYFLYIFPKGGLFDVGFQKKFFFFGGGISQDLNFLFRIMSSL